MQMESKSVLVLSRGLILAELEIPFLPKVAQLTPKTECSEHEITREKLKKSMEGHQKDGRPS